MSLKTVSKTYSWGNIELTELKSTESEGGDTWEHTLSFLDTETLALVIPLVNKNLKAISARDIVWGANLRGLPQRILDLDLSARKKCIMHMDEFYRPIKANVDFILAHRQLEIYTSHTGFLAGASEKYEIASNIEYYKKRVFGDIFLGMISDRKLPLKAKAISIHNYMENHFFLSCLLRYKNQEKRADLIEASIKLGCNPNRIVEMFSNDNIVRTTPLHAIAKEALFDERYISIVQTLLKYGANPLAVIDTEGTPRELIDAETTAHLNFYQHTIISLITPRSASQNLRASFQRVNALLVEYENA